MRRDNIQPVIEVLTEVASLGGVTEVDLCCSHNPQIDRANLIRAEWCDFAHLKGRAAVSLALLQACFQFHRETACHHLHVQPVRAAFLSSRESTCLVTEQFAFNRSGKAPQLSATKLPLRRWPQLCSNCATTSLPLPVSPATSTSTSVSAISRKVRRRFSIAGVWPINGRSPSTFSAASRKARFSTISCRFSHARRMLHEPVGCKRQR